MNKAISILLLFALLVTCFSGCALIDRLTGGSQTENPTEEPTEPVSKYNNPMDLPEDMLDALVDYLDLLDADVNIIMPSAATKISSIKNGKQALHVVFDPSNFYYICGYYNSTHQYGESFPSYCCAKEYEWVKFDRANDIQEYYNGAKMTVAFQINKALFVKDIISGETDIPDIEHFQLYTPVFLDERNTNVPIDFNETCIYLNEPCKSILYRSFFRYNHEMITFPCVLLDTQYYIPIQLNVIYSNGQISHNNLAKKFGSYYDTVMDIMITEKYSVTYENGAVGSYGLLEINQFANVILK